MKQQDKIFIRQSIFSQLKTSRLFIGGLIIKILLSLFFASTFLSDLFAPFIKASITSDFWNVYKDFYYLKPNAFPYPPVMLYLLALPEYILALTGLTGTAVSSIDLLFIRLPLLAADIAILVVLIKWLHNTKGVLIWYWLNPIVIYISFVHGQLDIIPTAFLCIALFFLFTERLWLFVGFLSLACATKFHVIITVPLLIIYLVKAKKISFGKLGTGIGMFILLLFIFNAPFLFQEEYIKMVYQNSEQGKALVSAINMFDSYRIILIPAFYMVILYLIIDFNFINRDLLLVFLALSFGIITVFIVPRQGWYMWNMPFLIYFIVRFNFQASSMLLITTAAYFIFFTISPESDFPLVAQYINPDLRTTDNLYNYLVKHNVNADIPMQMAFTFLQTSLFLLCVSIFRIGILKIRGHKIYHQPYLIGICGDSGTGKSTISKSINDLFGASNTLIVRGDDMHRWERGDEKWNEYTHLNPKANWLHRDLSQLLDLKAGKKILRRAYDHDTGKFTKERILRPNKVILYEGLHSFYLKEASRIYDLKVFMKPTEPLRRYWKIKRDVEKRGYTKEKVLETIEKRMQDSVSHIHNQEAEADIIFALEEKAPVEYSGTANETVDTQLKITCSNDIYFEQLLDVLTLRNITVSHDINHIRQEIIIDGYLQADELQDIALYLGLDIQDLTGTLPKWDEGYIGLMQIFLLYLVFRKFRTSGMLLKTVV